MSMLLSKVIERADYWRGSPAGRPSADDEIPYKEWQHFVVFGPDWVLVFNLNLDAEKTAGQRCTKARVITIFSGKDWHGRVEQCREPLLRRGGLEARFDNAGMRWEGGRYEIWQNDGDIRLQVELEPGAIPSLTHNIPLGGGSHLSWCLIPRLRARGHVEVNGEKFKFSNLGAYHDHNWGRFHWGGDFSWEWGCALPENPDEPWTLVYARMNSGDRNNVMATSVFLLENGRHLRYFRNAEVEFGSSAEMSRKISGRIPATAALLLPDEDLDVPACTSVAARRGTEWLDADITATSRGQVLVPSELDYCKIVRLNEANARAEVRGRCAGRDVRFTGPSLLEVVRV